MDKQDQEIKKALQDLQMPIIDPNFTKDIVAAHLSKSEKKISFKQVDIGSLLTGMIGVFIALAVTYVNFELSLSIKTEHLFILQILPVSYLVFQVLNEYLLNSYKPKVSFN